MHMATRDYKISEVGCVECIILSFTDPSQLARPSVCHFSLAIPSKSPTTERNTVIKSKWR